MNERSIYYRLMSKGKKTRKMILEEAISIASVVGLKGFSIGELAKQAGMSKSGLFGHFGSKEALQFAVLETVVEDFKIKVMGPGLQGRTGEARLRKLFEYWMDWATAGNKASASTLMNACVELEERPGQLRNYLVQEQIIWIDCIRRSAQKAVAEGLFKQGLDTAQFAFQFHSIGLGFHFSQRLLQDPKTPGRARTFFETLIESAKN